MIIRDDWDEHWDSMTHTATEYQREIRSLRERITAYLKDIEDLKAERHELTVNWIKAQDEIQALRQKLQSFTGQ